MKDKMKEFSNPDIKNNKKKSSTLSSISSNTKEPETEEEEEETKEEEEEEQEEKYNLESEYKKLDCSNENLYSKECNKFLLKKEFSENKYLKENPDSDTYLYPNLNDTKFNIKIAEKKEFNDTKYDGIIYDDVKKHADDLSKAEFELSPHQAFIKNFVSLQTPYNSLLLYHGLGSGKTCSAIGVSEEERDYMKQMGITKRIIIVASENVQDNFKLQLFDERKLKLVNGIWNIKSCVGNKLLKEINPTNIKNFPKENIITQIKNLINKYYLFLGYGQFANYIIKIINYDDEIERRKENSKKIKQKVNEKVITEKVKDQDIKITLNPRILKKLRNEFNNRLIIIDEVHNIRITDDNENKKVAINLELLVKSALNMKFLLLSATPMYNSYKEIIWLLNLMNTNDRRGRIEIKDIFDKNGEFKKNGEELLIRKATGYISFVRGENPYTFPYKVYPSEFAIENTFPTISYPSYQMNLKKIKDENKSRILSLYLNTIGNCNLCGNCQYCVYKYIIYNLRNKIFSTTTKTGIHREMPSFENMESFGYTLLQIPLESLIISYPIQGLKEIINSIPKEDYSEKISEDFIEEINESQTENELPGTIDSLNDLSEEPLQELNENSIDKIEKIVKPSDKQIKPAKQNNFIIDPNNLTGKKGLERTMDFIDSKSPPEKGKFKYKKSTLDNYGKFFSQEIIGKYSSKIKSILENIKISKGIILIYSQYIDGGLIPVALALEEMGFTRYGKEVNSLFETPPTPVIDVKTMKPPTDKKFMPARYSMITGDPRLSPNNDYEVKGLTNEDNKDGNRVKIVLISKAGSEGIDLKYIRQVHILEPWYNMNRLDQIVGRAVRNFSHKDLDFEERNVQIFMYGTILEEENKEESADLYVYRIAEYKAIQIGKISRILKETSIDCIINHDQTNFTQEKMNRNLKEAITQKLSTGQIINNFKIGDAPFSSSCDYMSTCNYSCRPNKIIKEADINEDTYNEKFIVLNSEKIIQKIKILFKEEFFYKKDILINAIQIPKKYPVIQIYSALTQLIEDDTEFITDKYNRTGRLINIDNYYLFQPIELKYNNISIFERSVPIDYKHNMIEFNINPNIRNKEKKIVKQIEKESSVVKQIDTIELTKDIEEREKEKTLAKLKSKKIKAKEDLEEKDLEEDDLEEKNLEEEKEDQQPDLKELISKFNITKEYITKPRVERGDDTWYKHAGILSKQTKIRADFPDMPKEFLIEFLVDHIIETLLFDEKKQLINFLYQSVHLKVHSFEWFAKKYFERNTIVIPHFHIIILYNLNKIQLMILNDKNRWMEAEPVDERDIFDSKQFKKILNFDIKDYNYIIGFIGYEKNNKYLTFKTKDLTSTRDTGARCDEAGKYKTITLLNTILGEEKYTKENTKLEKDASNKTIKDAVSHTELCVLQEFILRYYEKIQKDNKKWFLSPEMAIYHKLYKINL